MGGAEMPFREQSRMTSRLEFVQVARQDGANIRALCRQYRISPTTGYKWLARYAETGKDGLTERSRRPARSPTQTPAAMDAAIVALRTAHPAWGGRKLGQRLLDLGHTAVPSASTITAILRRHDLLTPQSTRQTTAWQRFEHGEPNALWQLDFTGHMPLGTGRVHPLPILDDHARFLVGLFACGDERLATVKTHLTTCFRQYGLPWAILSDNGSPWGVPHVPERLSSLEVWLLRLGVELWHGRIRHPQTQGKVERFHRTLAAERLQPYRYADLADCQTAFDAWRDVYNLERPHAALGLAVPASRYQPSLRVVPETLPMITYGPDDAVRKVVGTGQISYGGTTHYVSQALLGESVAVRPTTEDGLLDVVFAHLTIRQIDLRTPAVTLPHDALD
jgi:transposase InsO family protein